MANKETKKETKKAKCPICGCFTSKETLQAAKAKYDAKLNALQQALADEQQKNESLSKWLDDARNVAEARQSECQKALDRVLYLESRGLWARIWNK